MRDTGTVECWGDDDDGRATPPAGNFVSVSAGEGHTCGVRDTGAVECWGQDSDGQSTPPPGTFTAVSAWHAHTCGVRDTGAVECWGDDEHGGSTPPAGTFVSVSAGYWHACGVRNTGAVACWGWDSFGQATIPVEGPVTVDSGSDSFFSRSAISGASGQGSGSNSGGSKESGEPIHAGNTGGASMWWSWTAPATGMVTFDTEGSDFDTLLAVYTGGSVGALSLVASDDDTIGRQSEVSFTAQQGVAYHIAVDGYGGATGSILLNWQQGTSVDPGTEGPVTVDSGSDSFFSRSAISGASGQGSGSNSGGSKESGEPIHAGNTGGASMWWSWTAPATGMVTFDTEGSDFDTLLAVYTGGSVGALSLVASDDDTIGRQSEVSFTAQQGVAYHIAVDGYGGATGSILLNWQQGTSVDPGTEGPVTVDSGSDSFFSRSAISGASGQGSGSNSGGSKESGEPIHAGNTGGASMWWSWTAPATGMVTFDTEGSDFDTLLAVYTGGSVGALSLVASDDDTIGRQSEVSFTAQQGVAYHIAVDGYGGATGSILLNWQQGTSVDPGTEDPVTVDSVGFVSVSSGHNHTCGILEAGFATCWGLDREGVYGYGQSTPPEGRFVSVSAGGFYTCGLSRDRRCGMLG